MSLKDKAGHRHWGKQWYRYGRRARARQAGANIVIDYVAHPRGHRGTGAARLPRWR